MNAKLLIIPLLLGSLMAFYAPVSHAVDMNSTQNATPNTIGSDIKTALAGITDPSQAIVAVQSIVNKAISNGTAPADVAAAAIKALLSHRPYLGKNIEKAVITDIVHLSVQAAIKGKTGNDAVSATNAVIDAAKKAAPSHSVLIHQAANYAVYGNIIDLTRTGNTTIAAGALHSFYGSTYSEAQTDIFQFLRSNIEAATNINESEKKRLLQQVDAARSGSGTWNNIGTPNKCNNSISPNC